MLGEGYGGQQQKLEGEDLLRYSLELNKHLIEAINASESMRVWMTTPHGRAIQNNAERGIMECIALWLSDPDPGSQKSRGAHFRARMLVSMMQEIDHVINTGEESIKTVKANDNELNGVSDDNE